MKSIVRNDGVIVPTVGFGTFCIPSDGSAYRARRLKADYITTNLYHEN